MACPYLRFILRASAFGCGFVSWRCRSCLASSPCQAHCLSELTRGDPVPPAGQPGGSQNARACFKTSRVEYAVAHKSQGKTQSQQEGPGERTQRQSACLKCTGL